MENEEFTLHQINNWRLYEMIRAKGAYNMLSKEARIAVGLPVDEYMFVLNNYEELEIAAANLR